MVSIIVPIYNVEEYLRECLYSIVQQTYKDIEILCINDCTLDNSVSIVHDFCRRDSRIRLISHKHNKGLGGARNTGIQQAKGEYILFVDSDDGIAPNMVQLLLEAIERDCADVAICGVLDFYPDGTSQKSTAFHYRKYVQPFLKTLDTEEDYAELTNMWPSASNKLFRADIIKKYGCKFPEKILYEDHAFYYSYFQHVKCYTYIGKALYYYRHARPGSITSYPTGREKEIFEIIEGVKQNLREMLGTEREKLEEMKLSYRLLAERQFVLANYPKAWMKFCKNARLYLCQNYSLEELKMAVDPFLANHSPFYDYVFSKEKRAKIKIKYYLKKLPFMKRILRKLRHQKPAEPIAEEIIYKNSPIRNPLVGPQIKKVRKSRNLGCACELP